MAAISKKHVNLLPKEDFERTALGRIMKWALTSFRFIVIVVELVVVASFLLRFWFDVQISDLEDEILQKSALISSKSSFEGEFREVQTKLAIFSSIANEKNSTLPLLQTVSLKVPEDTQLMEFTRNGQNVTLSGAALSELSITRFISGLREEQQFESVELSRLETKDDTPFTEFVINIKVLDNTGV